MPYDRAYYKTWAKRRKSKPMDILEQRRRDEKNRCATLRFEAHFVEIANRWGATVFDYRREERVDG